jgi:AraC family transcriptional regulator, regulatory protein of adaptative response / methylated-DNA-[protein]-cysteine methyltransferase
MTALNEPYPELLNILDDFYLSINGSPHSEARNVINIQQIETPVGIMYCCASEKGICMLEFSDRRALKTEFKELIKYLDAPILPGENSHIENLKEQLSGYFDGKLYKFNLALHTPGTEFQRKVWEKLIEIPFGETRSYKQQAIALNNPEAVRAVANANGKNRVSIVIPCHRVIGEDGSLTGYGGGLGRKRWLLDHESKFKRLF